MSATQPGSGRCWGRHAGSRSGSHSDRVVDLARGLVVAACAAVLVACGGGGGGGITSSPAEITAGNADLISAEVLRSIDIAATLGPVSTDATIGSGGGGGAQAQRLAGSSRRSIQRATTLVAFGPDTLACDADGTVQFSGDRADFDTFTPGDVINATFTDCDDGAGDVINGSLRLVVVQAVIVNFDDGRFDVTFDATFTNLRVTIDGRTYAGDGTSRLTVDTTGTPIEATISGAGEIVFTEGGDRYGLTDFAVTLSVNLTGQPGASSVTGTGTLDSNDIDGPVDFVTVVPLLTNGTAFPSAGTLDIIGADDARIRVTVLDATSLELAVDTNGDDVTDVTIPTTWATLRSISGVGAVGSSVLQSFDPIEGPDPRDPS
jgi:hypothetical protein